MCPVPVCSLHKAGTDCVGHLIWASTDTDPRLTVLSVDGIGAYDHVLRSAMLGRLLQTPAARAILPFVRLSQGSPSSYTWVDGEGQQRTVTQGEGGEHGPSCHCSSPLAFKVRLTTSLAPGEHLCAFLVMFTCCVSQSEWSLYTSCSVKRWWPHQVAPRENQGVEPGWKSARGRRGVGA